MELTAKIAAMDEEIALLKSEIKSILQEVRTAVLARENPFATALDNIRAAPSPVEPPAPVEVREETPAAVIQLRRVEDPVPVPAPPVAAPRHGPAPAASESARPAEPRQWDAHTLAALMSWTQEMAERFSQSDLGLVLSLARYGGLIEAGLELTLGNMAGTVERTTASRRAAMGDFLLALRQLEAVLQTATRSESATQRDRWVA